MLKLLRYVISPRFPFYISMILKLENYLIQSEAFDYLDAPVERITGADLPTPYAQSLEDLAFPTTELIVKVIKRSLYRS